MKEMASTQASATQSLFYAAVKEGMETHGVELDEPTVAYVCMTAKQPASSEDLKVKKESSEVSDDESDGYETIYHEIEGRGPFPSTGGLAEGKLASNGRSATPHRFKPQGGDKMCGNCVQCV